jgi:alpha/beta superfamily hydrolase
MKKIAVFNHGKDSSPNSPKISVLSKIASDYGYEIESVDYTAQTDPDERVKQLLALDFSEFQQVLLVGSSMGAYVATVASEQLHPHGLFLMAPAFYLPGYRRTEFNPPVAQTMVIHGWSDEIVPPENSWRFCQQHKIRLKMIEADHVFSSALPELEKEFILFLDTLR